MGLLSPISAIYVNRDGARKKAVKMLTHTAAGMKPWVSQWLVDLPPLYLKPPVRQRQITADLHSDGTFSLPGATDTVTHLPIGIDPNFALLRMTEPMWDDEQPDEVTSVQIMATSGEYHEVPATYWGTSSELDFNEATIGGARFGLKVSPDELVSALGLSVSFPARFRVKTKAQDYVVHFVDFDVELESGLDDTYGKKSYYLGWFQYYRGYAAGPTTDAESFATFNTLVASGTHFEAGSAETGFDNCVISCSLAEQLPTGEWALFEDIEKFNPSFSIREYEGAPYIYTNNRLIEVYYHRDVAEKVAAGKRLVVCHSRLNFPGDPAFISDVE